MNSKPLSELLEEAFVQCRDMDASLAERLQAFADAVRELGPIFQSSVDDLVARLRAHDVGDNAPKPGEKMPDFVLPDEKGHLVSLDQLLKKGPVAVTFHRGHWCPYCRINTRALAEAQDADRRSRRTGCRHHARSAAFHRRAQGPVRGAVPDPYRYRQRLRAVPQSGLLGRGGDARTHVPAPAGMSLHRKEATPGCCRSRQPSWSALTAR